jgi:hypothetical protein
MAGREAQCSTGGAVMQRSARRMVGPNGPTPWVGIETMRRRSPGGAGRFRRRTQANPDEDESPEDGKGRLAILGKGEDAPAATRAVSAGERQEGTPIATSDRGFVPGSKPLKGRTP